MNNKIISLINLKEKLKRNKKKLKVVLCHGVFDLLHIGHIKHFNKAKKFGDILVVSLTPDRFIRKGPNRPFFSLQYRLESIANLQSVDYVTWNNEEGASDVILSLKPKYYCKGEDYKNLKLDLTKKINDEINNLKKVGGKIKFTNEGKFSSSKILSKKMEIFDENQKKLIDKLKKKYSYSKIISIFQKIKIIKPMVIGEIIIDQYAFGEALGKSGKEPIMMIKNLKEEQYLGGSGAIANHLSTFLNKINLFSMIGEKKEYNNFIAKKLEKNINYSFFLKKKSPTIVKKRYLDHITQNKIIGFYTINDDKISLHQEESLIKQIRKKIKVSKVNIIADYGHGMITNSAAKHISKSKNFIAINSQFNAANIGTSSVKKYNNVDLIIINEKELRNEMRNNSEKLEVLTKNLTKNLRVKNLIVTRGKNGALMYNNKKNKFFYCPAFANKSIDRVGAGDAMLAIVSIFLYFTKDELLSLFIGSLAAAEQVQTIGNKFKINKNSILKLISHLLE